MKAHSWREIVHSLLSVGLVCSVVVGAVLVLPPQEAQSQETPQAELAYIGSDGNVWLIHADGTNRRQLTSHGVAWHVAWAPDGSGLAFVKNAEGYSSDVMVIDPDSGSESLLASGLYGVVELTWSPDGRALAFQRWADSGGSEWVLEELLLDSRDTVVLARRPTYGIGNPIPWQAPGIAWGPLSDRVVWCDYPFALLTIISVGAEMPSVVWQGTGHDPAWSPEGSRLAWNVSPSEIVISDQSGSELRRIDTGNVRGWRSLAWSPGGDTIALGGQGGLWLLHLESGGLRQLVEDEVWDPEWSADGSQLAFTYTTGLGSDTHLATWGVGVVDVAGGQVRLLDSAGIMPAWRPVGSLDVSPLVNEKRSLIPVLSSPTFDFLGIPMPCAGYDEAASSELLARLGESQGTGLLSISEVSALQRLVLTEEALSDLYPHYAVAADDTADGTLSLLLIGLGFIGAFREVDKNLADTPFAPIAHELSIRITAKIVGLLNKAFERVEYTISDPGEREAFRMMRETIWRAVQLRIMEAQDPFVDRGMTFLNAFSDVTLKPVAIRVLLDRYVGQTQPIIDRAVHTADPEYTGSDKNEVHTTDERARIQKEGVIDQVGIWSEYHHETYEHFKETADLPGVVGDLADIASMTGILAPIGQVVARASDVMEGLLVGYGSVKSWQFLQCLESQAFDAEARIYDPSIPGGEYSGPCERAHRLGLFSLRDDEERGVVLDREAKARVEGELAEYGAMVESVLEVLEGGDEKELAVLIEQLLEEDEALGGEMGMIDVALAATDPEGSTELYAREVEFQLQSVVFYASLIDALMASGDGGELKGQAIVEGEGLLDALASYGVAVEAIPEVVETREEAGTALLAIRRVNVPEVELGEEASLEVQVTNLGSASSGEVTVRMTGGEHMRIAEEKVHVGLLDPGQEEVVVFNGEGASEGTEILMVELYEANRYVSGEMVLAEVSPGEGVVTAPQSTFEPWMGLLCGVIGLIPVLLGSGIGVWLWRRASREVQRCPHCGAENVLDSTYCIGCGQTPRGGVVARLRGSQPGL